jgi:hypothetical protein
VSGASDRSHGSGHPAIARHCYYALMMPSGRPWSVRNDPGGVPAVITGLALGGRFPATPARAPWCVGGCRTTGAVPSRPCRSPDPVTAIGGTGATRAEGEICVRVAAVFYDIAERPHTDQHRANQHDAHWSSGHSRSSDRPCGQRLGGRAASSWSRIATFHRAPVRAATRVTAPRRFRVP